MPKEKPFLEQLTHVFLFTPLLRDISLSTLMILWPHVQLKDDVEHISNQPTLLLICLYLTHNTDSQKRKHKDLAIHLDLPCEMTLRVPLPSKDVISSTTFTPL